MTPRPRIATRLLVGHGALIAICLSLAGLLLLSQAWSEQDRRALVEEALPRFSDALAVSRLGDALAETAGALAAAADDQDRRAALERMAQARRDLDARMAALGGNRLEASTRARLDAAVADMAEALDTLDALVDRRLTLSTVAGDLNARLGVLGDLLPDLERALLSGRAPEGLDRVIDMTGIDFPPGPSGTTAANAVRRWARNAQVAVGMMLAASGAGETADLDYLALRAEESLRRAAAASREADRSAMPVMETVQADLTAIAEGVNGADSVFRVRRQRLTMDQNTPAVLARAQQASDRLTAGVTQIVADVEQARHVRDVAMDRMTWIFRGTAALLLLGGVAVALWSGVGLWQAVCRRLRRLTGAVLAARDDDGVVLPQPDPRPDEIGALVRAVQALDVERRRSVSARRDHAARLAGVFETLSDGVLVLSADQRIEDANPAAARLLGVAGVPSLLGRALESVLPAADATTVSAAATNALEQPGRLAPPVAVTLPIDGGPGNPTTQRRALTIRLNAPAEAGGRQIVVVLHDPAATDGPTPSLQAGAPGADPLPAHTDAMADLGAMVAPLAHDLSTPLGVGTMGASHIGARTRAVRDAYAAGTLNRSSFESYAHEVIDTAEVVESALRRAAALVESLRTVSVDQVTERRRPVRLGALLDDIATMLAPRLQAAGIRLSVSCPADLTLDSYPGALFRVLLNLVENARIHGFPDDAGPGGPRDPATVTLVAEPGRSAAGQGDDAVETIDLTVRDNGAGMAPAVQARLFERFFTTRSHRGGSGLGMAIVHNMVSGPLGGTLTVDSREGAGTAVTLHLPVCAPDSSAPTALAGTGSALTPRQPAANAGAPEAPEAPDSAAAASAKDHSHAPS